MPAFQAEPGTREMLAKQNAGYAACWFQAPPGIQRAKAPPCVNGREAEPRMPSFQAEPGTRERENERMLARQNAG